MNCIIKSTCASFKFIFHLKQIHLLFFITLILHSTAFPFQISRSKSSPNILSALQNNEHVLLQGINDLSLINHTRAQGERSRLMNNASQASSNNTNQSLASQFTQSSQPASKQNEVREHQFYSNYHGQNELHADKRSLPKDLALSSLKHAPSIIHAIVSMLKNRANIDQGILPKKLLLVGDPGTGKTTLGKAIGYACKMPVVKYTASAIADRYKDSGAKNLEKIFYEAEALEVPCIVIIDELEALIKRYDSKNDSEAGMIVTLWTLLDQFEDSSIFFIGTLNNAKEAPQQVKNRFSEFIEHVPLPDAAQRKELLEFYMSSCKKLNFKDISIDQLVQLTTGFAHRNLKGLINFACIMAYLRDSKANIVIMDDFLNALKGINKKAVHIHGNLFERAENKVSKWGPSAHIGIALLGSGIALTTLICGVKAQITGLNLQRQALQLQMKSLELQQKSFFVQLGGLALNAVGIIVTIATNIPKR